MTTFIGLLNLFLGLWCLIGAVDGMMTHEWTQVCAFCLFYIAFDNAISDEEDRK